MCIRDRYRLLSQMSQTQSDLEAVLTVIKAKRADLKDVQGRLRDQIKLCHEEIGLGARWGSKPAPGTEAPDLDESPNVDKQTLKDLHEMFMGTGVEEPDLAAVVPAEPTPEEPATLPDPTGSDAESDDFLDAISTPETGEDLRSIDDLLGDLGI